MGWTALLWKAMAGVAEEARRDAGRTKACSAERLATVVDLVLQKWHALCEYEAARRREYTVYGRYDQAGRGAMTSSQVRCHPAFLPAIANSVGGLPNATGLKPVSYHQLSRYKLPGSRTQNNNRP